MDPGEEGWIGGRSQVGVKGGVSDRGCKVIGRGKSHGATNHGHSAHLCRPTWDTELGPYPLS